MVGRIGRRSTAALLALTLASVIVGAAIADGTSLLPSLQFDLGAEVAPMTLSKSQMQPVALDFHGRVSMPDGTHPSALREMTIELDHDLSIDTTGVSVCRPAPQYDIRMPPGALRRRCKGSIVGGGKAGVEIAFPEDPSIREQSPVSIYNGGLRDGAQTLYVHSLVRVPVPVEIVSTIEIKRVRQKRYGSRLIVKIPVIAGGSGSLLDFDLRIKRLFELGGVHRSVVTARCPDGRLDVKAESLLFRNEAHTPGVAPTTTMKGDLTIPCAPTR